MVFRYQIKTVQCGGQFWIFVDTKVRLMITANAIAERVLHVLTLTKHMSFIVIKPLPND